VGRNPPDWIKKEKYVQCPATFRHWKKNGQSKTSVFKLKLKHHNERKFVTKYNAPLAQNKKSDFACV
ncbi:MAG: hypothetical protein LUD48_03300, partial [Prevotella sp.]|nr:hypothetical protein [Prevotella sp.]